jgi:hypothetical protein
MGSVLTDVGMVDLGEEAHFGWVHWVFFRKEELEVEDTTCEKSACSRLATVQAASCRVG